MCIRDRFHIYGCRRQPSRLHPCGVSYIWLPEATIKVTPLWCFIYMVARGNHQGYTLAVFHIYGCRRQPSRLHFFFTPLPFVPSAVRRLDDKTDSSALFAVIHFKVHRGVWGVLYYFSPGYFPWSSFIISSSLCFLRGSSLWSSDPSVLCPMNHNICLLYTSRCV